jgi:hypothetical protein
VVESPHSALLVAATVLSVLAVACSGWALTRSVPASFRRLASEATDAVERIESEWRRERVALEGYIEQVQALLESVETKRRRIAAAESKREAAAAGMLGAGGEPNFGSMSAEQQREWATARARQRGLM